MVELLTRLVGRVIPRMSVTISYTFGRITKMVRGIWYALRDMTEGESSIFILDPPLGFATATPDVVIPDSLEEAEFRGWKDMKLTVALTIVRIQRFSKRS